MATNHHIEGGTILGTVSGTGLTVLANIGSSDILKTVVLAAIGAVVSFCVSVSLKWLAKKLRK
jgi:mannitol-specific phosphotransferase system IIBC component